MIRTYRETQLPDGTRVVESTGPIARTWIMFRIAIACLIFPGALVALFQGHFSSFVIGLIVGAIILPTRRKWTMLRLR